MNTTTRTTLEGDKIVFTLPGRKAPLPYGFTVGEMVSLTNVKGDVITAKAIAYADDHFLVELKHGTKVAAPKEIVSHG